MKIKIDSEHYDTIVRLEIEMDDEATTDEILNYFIAYMELLGYYTGHIKQKLED